MSATATVGWMAPARALLERLEATQSAALDEAARVCTDAIAGDGLVHMFGSGHSRMAVEEMFPRYGSYPGFNPIVELSMTFHTQVVGANGQRQAMFIERMEGLGEEILKNYRMATPDAMVVVSASGLGAVTIDIAAGARARGLPVIALTSVEASDAGEPAHSSGTRLYEHADVVLDLCTPVGDALVAMDGLKTPLGPGSTVASVALVNELKVRTATLLHARDALPPVLTSPALVGAERSRALFDAAYDEHGRRLGRALSKNGTDKHRRQTPP